MAARKRSRNRIAAWGAVLSLALAPAAARAEVERMRLRIDGLS